MSGKEQSLEATESPVSESGVVLPSPYPERAGTLEEIRNAASCLVWVKREDGETVLADWHHNEVPATRLRELLEDDLEARGVRRPQ